MLLKIESGIYEMKDIKGNKIKDKYSLDLIISYLKIINKSTNEMKNLIFKEFNITEEFDYVEKERVKFYEDMLKQIGIIIKLEKTSEEIIML